jgi:hypothetical protein
MKKYIKAVKFGETWQSITWAGKSKYGQYPGWYVSPDVIGIQLLNGVNGSITAARGHTFDTKTLSQFIGRLVNKAFNADELTDVINNEITAQTRRFITLTSDMIE